jgi:hypothetical protein
MTLAAVTKGRPADAPVSVLIHGVDGIGKSTFAAGAPAPIFIDTEDGSAGLGVARFPRPETWADVLEAVRTLETESHDFRTLVIDSIDWAETLAWRDVCARAKVETIEEVGGGFGKGYVAAVDCWRQLLFGLERLKRAKRMNVVLVAHTLIKMFKNPLGEDFERYQVKLHASSAAVLREWCDDVLFANYDVIATKDPKTKRVRGVDTGNRLLHTVWNAAWDAKNRSRLPAVIPLSWADYWAAVQKAEPADPKAIREEIERIAADAGDFGQQAIDALGRAGDDAGKLAQLLNWLSSKVEVSK